MRSVSTLIGVSWPVQRKGGADSIAQRQGIVEAFYDDTVTRQKLHVSPSVRIELRLDYGPKPHARFPSYFQEIPQRYCIAR